MIKHAQTGSQPVLGSNSFGSALHFDFQTSSDLTCRPRERRQMDRDILRIEEAVDLSASAGTMHRRRANADLNMPDVATVSARESIGRLNPWR